MADIYFENALSIFRGYDIVEEQLKCLEDAVAKRVTSAEAAKQLTAYPQKSSTPLELNQRLGGLWTLLNDTAVHLPSTQECIISILSEIKQLPMSEVPRGEGEEYFDFDEGFYWKELTGWENDWGDNYNYWAAQFLIEKSTGEEREKRRQQWISACQYTARLSATNDPALSSYGKSLEDCTSTISEALENETGDQGPENVEAAAILFIYAGRELYRRCVEGNTKGMLEWKSELWKGEKGFSSARWRFWLERWTVLTQQEKLSEERRRAAQSALSAMQNIDRTSGQ
ncbi:hypothetical protein DM02DRAFT_305128 [Periconia macrospinosa]|uniref:Uncharacterized protein n=1 Tax=Periconia macrospinosa TaxID=97972 RepID=A0A2V1D1Z1_9PLEO|nr:hypothetical protein DM02DRAFT_305128 [Periconia macrospinosa]